MLAFPKNTMACDLAGRMAKIIDYMGTKCDTVWNQIWGGKVRDLIRDSMPSDGSACSSEPIDSGDGENKNSQIFENLIFSIFLYIFSVRELNSMFEEIHDKNFNAHVKDETQKGNEEYKEWFAQQKAEEREAKRLEKEQLAAERAERRQVHSNNRIFLKVDGPNNG